MTVWGDSVWRFVTVVLVVMVLGVAGSASAARAARSASLPVGRAHAHFSVVPADVSPSAVLAQVAAAKTVAMWSGSVADGSTFSYLMVGKDPFTTQATPTTSIKTFLVSVKFTDGVGNVYDPGASEPCDPTGATPLSRVQGSPIFKTRLYTWGGTAIGKAQYVDAFQRAEFWSQTNPAGINPGYNVNLSLGTRTLSVSLTTSGLGGYHANATCTGDHLLYLDYASWRSYVQTTLLPSLAADGVGPASFPIFLLHNVVFYNGTISNCCILGYHGAFGSPTQTYAVADYDTTKDFGAGVKDVEGLSHEVAEWMNDPLGTNQTNPWGHIGQVTGCQSNLEVGDPLSDTTIKVFQSGFTYHPQELAFFSWFYHQNPSLGVNGWYSNNNTFTTPATACS